MTDNLGDSVVPSAVEELPLTESYLPKDWVLNIYNKGIFKKVANKPGYHAKPHRELCRIQTLNDLFFLIRLMGMKASSGSSSEIVPADKLNLDMNDYIIMRAGIEPVWEDPKNTNGGTFTIKIPHKYGYDLWTRLIMHTLGETLTRNMEDINGIGVSYISDAHDLGSGMNGSGTYTYIKIWDGKPGRTLESFLAILPIEIMEIIKDSSTKYTLNQTKKHFGQEDILKRINRPDSDYGYSGRGRGGYGGGGFDNRRGGRGRGGYGGDGFDNRRGGRGGQRRY